MSRGYIQFDGVKSIKAVRACQGHASDLTSDVGTTCGFGPALTSQLTSMKLIGRDMKGIWRARFIAENIGGGRSILCVELGRRLKGTPKGAASREASRLRDKAAKQTTRASTSSPGIEGFQNAADAASARLVNIQGESISLARWLEALEAPKKKPLHDPAVMARHQAKLEMAIDIVKHLDGRSGIDVGGNGASLSVNTAGGALGELEEQLAALKRRIKALVESDEFETLNVKESN